MADIWSITVQALLTAGATWFITRRLDKGRERHSKDIERIRTEQTQYLEGVRSDNAHALERFKGEQARTIEELKAGLSVLSRLQTQAAERRAGIAAEVLVSALTFLDALKVTATLAFQGEYNQRDPPQKVARSDFDARWREMEGPQKEFRSAWVLAEVHLPEEVSQLLGEIWGQMNLIRANQMTHVATLQNNQGTQFQFFEKGYGAVPEEQVKRLRETVRSKVRPLVSLEFEKAAMEWLEPAASQDAVRTS